MKRVQRAAKRAEKAQKDYERAASELYEAVKEARSEHSFAELAAVTGLTRQRVHQIAQGKSAPVFPRGPRSTARENEDGD